MDYQPALDEAKKELAKLDENRALYGKAVDFVAIIPERVLRDLVTGVEGFLRLEDAITEACDDDTQNDINDQYRLMSGEADLCPDCGIVTKGEHDEDCEVDQED